MCTPSLSYQELLVVDTCLTDLRNRNGRQDIDIRTYPAPVDYCHRLFRMEDTPCMILGNRLVLHIVDAIIESDMEIWERREGE